MEHLLMFLAGCLGWLFVSVIRGDDLLEVIDPIFAMAGICLSYWWLT